MQMLLLPDPRPLVERLGYDFFREAPECAGVYLMRDAGDSVLYVGKAKNLRKRLASYRVANPDRMKRRHLRLLRAVTRIELRQCVDEAGALATEAELLQTLRPRFNRAGTWRGPARFFGWRIGDSGVELTVASEQEEGWAWQGPLGTNAFVLRSSLARLLWCAIYPERGCAGMPLGWLQSDRREITGISGNGSPHFASAGVSLTALFSGDAEKFYSWIEERTAGQRHPFEIAARAEDLETIKEFVAKWSR